MSDPVKLPVWGTVGLALRWTLAFILRHPVVTVAYAAAVLASNLTSQLGEGTAAAAPPAGQFVWLNLLLLIVSVLISIMFALMVHNEVLRGHAGFDAATFGSGPGRTFGYLLDLVVIGLIAVAVLIVAVIALALIGVGGNILLGKSGSTVVTVIGGIATVIVAIGLGARLTLRLPSRAIGQPAPWKAIWRMGRGNTLRLIGMGLLLWLFAAVLMLPILGWGFMYLPHLDPAQPLLRVPFLLLVYSAVISPILTIAHFALLSVAFATLRPAEADGTGAAAFT